MAKSFETYLPWFILREIPKLGNRAYKKLLDQFGTPEKILKASRFELVSTNALQPETIDGILNYKKFEFEAKTELVTILENNIKIVTFNDPEYPVLLSTINDPPPFLTYLGTLNNESPCISIVGSRKATSYGLHTSENLSVKLARKGFQIVSGMARGIDSKAHTGALKAKQRTIAVLGSGLNKIYPKDNKDLFYRIAETGTVFSEFKVNAEPIPSNFPVRNRIIAGLSCGTIVVEAAKKSGSLITARLAGEYNREIFAVPGAITSIKSQGTHSLLKQGARLVEDEMDIISELKHFIHDQSKEKPQKNYLITNNDPINNQILKFIEPYPVHIDLLIEKSSMNYGEVSSQLLDLELSGSVIRHQGNYYSIPEERH